MPSYDDHWFPYLGDAVAIRAADRDLTGTATRYDASLIEVEVAGVDVQVGDTIGAAWRVRSDVHRGSGRVTDVSGHGFTVRLEPAPATPSRREHERVALSLPLTVTASQHGSYGAVPLQGRSLDLSNGGMRALLDADAGFGIGEVVTVELEIGGRVETLTASVVWESGHGSGERLAGLSFHSEVETGSWTALSRAGV